MLENIVFEMAFAFLSLSKNLLLTDNPAQSIEDFVNEASAEVLEIIRVYNEALKKSEDGSPESDDGIGTDISCYGISTSVGFR